MLIVGPGRQQASTQVQRFGFGTSRAVEPCETKLGNQRVYGSTPQENKTKAREVDPIGPM